MKQWELAYGDWLSGMKYKEIADRHSVSENTVKAWAARYFKPKKESEQKKKVATKGKKKLQLSSDKLQPESPPEKKKRGAPLGNTNAEGNSGGAPYGNTNRLKHGLYSKVYLDTLDETERKLIEEIPTNEEELLIQQIELFTIRERRHLLMINKYREKITGLSVSQVIRSEWKKEKPKLDEAVEEWSDEGEKDKDGRPLKHSYHLDTYTKANIDIVRSLENELTKIQAKKIQAIECLNRLRQVGGGDGNGNMDLLTASIDEARKLLDGDSDG